MNRIIAGLALIGILAWAIFYNVRERSSPPRATTATAVRSVTTPPIPTTPFPKPAPQADRSISVAGTLRADRQAAISSRVPGRVVEVLARNGQLVRAGKVLIRLDVGDIGAQAEGAEAGVAAAEAQYRKAIDGKRARTVELDSRISEAEGGLRTALAKQRQAELALRLGRASTTLDTERARAAVRQAEAGLRQADAAYKQAADTLKRTKFLFSRGGVAKADLEGAQAQADISKAQRDAAAAGLEQARAAVTPAEESAPLRQQVSEADLEAARSGVREAREGAASARRAKAESLRIADSDIDSARAQVDQARAGWRQATSQAGSSVLTAPFDGVVADANVRVGETAQPGQPLMMVTGIGSLYVDAAVPARTASLVRAGMRAVVRLDTAPDQKLAGWVTEVLPVSADGRSIPVRVRFSSRAKPMPGTGARADILLTEAGT